MRSPGESKVHVAIALAILIGGVHPSSATAQGPTRQIGAPRGEFLFPVVVTGEVNRPGTFTVINNLMVTDLLEMAGGLTSNASRTVILVHFSDRAPLSPPSRAILAQLVRPGSPVPRNITLTRIPVAANIVSDTRVHVEPQDIVFVPDKSQG